MARRKKKSPKDSQDLVQVDIYYIPTPIAEMYKVLRNAVKDDTLAFLEEMHAKGIEIIQDPTYGESIRAEIPAFFYALSPTNISNAQEARDREEFETYLQQFMQEKS